MIACKECNGDGVVWVPADRVGAQTNINGRRFRSSDGLIHTFYTYDGVLDRVAWEFVCCACSGRGIIEWTRGKSLLPSPPSKG